METPRSAQRTSMIVAAVAITAACVAGYVRIGLPPVVIVGGSGVVAYFMWYRTYLARPTDPRIILPPFLLVAASLEVHMLEEYLTKFGPAMSRLFDIAWTEHSFLLVFAFIGPALYSLTALGLYYKVPLAGFVAWFIFIGPGLAEFTHFIFPLLRPAIRPELAATISQPVSDGTFVGGMPNYYFRTTGSYYFAGMYTAVLPMIPGIYAIRRVWRAAQSSSAAGQGTRVPLDPHE